MSDAGTLFGTSLHLAAHVLGLAASAAACGYAAFAAALGVMSPRARESRSVARLPPITILKPLCGAEPRLYEQLHSFCVQGNAETQIVFGVQSSRDAAVPVVQRLQDEFPGRDLQLVIDSGIHGANRKASNLINMIERARHDYLVIADSDVLAPPDYLERVTLPLLDRRVGLVTCLYRGRPSRGLWSALGVLFIDDWFAPAVRVAAAFGSQTFASGATLAIRRDTLASVGGFEAFADHLADDYELGKRVRGLGLRTVLSDVVVETAVDERTFGAFVRHHLRWLRTIRSIQPLGFLGAVLTMSLPVATVGLLLAGASITALTLFTVTVVSRIALHLRAAWRADRSAWPLVLLVPLHDLVTFSLWCVSFMKPQITWREQRYLVAPDGTLHPLEDQQC